MNRFAATVMRVVAFFLVGTMPAFAQQLNVGSLTGVIRDSSGAAIPGAQVTATNQDTGLTQLAIGSETGIYVINLLPVGNYTLTVTKAGFSRLEQKDIPVLPGQTFSRDFEMTVGATTQLVTVKAEAPVLDTTSANMGNGAAFRQIQDLPITLSGNSARGAISIVTTLPGVNYDPRESCGQSWTVVSRASINGVAPGLFGYEIDGIYGGPGAGESAEERVTPVPEQIQEVRLTDNTDASQGFNGGVSLDLVSRSGTSEFHGTTYYYLRNQALEARSFFFPTTPQDQQNQWGFVLGGPVKLPHLYTGKNKTFFFVAFDWFRYRFNLSPTHNVTTATVPTAAMQGGDFRQWLGPQVGTDELGRPVFQGEIYDPSTTRPDGKGGFLRDPYIYNGQLNVIPPSKFSSISQYFQTSYAAPTGSGITNNWVGFARENAIDKDQLSFKIDETVGEKHRFSFSRERDENWFNPQVSGHNGHWFIFGGDGYLGPAINDGFIDDRDEYRYRFNYVWTLRNNLLFNFRAGVNRSPHRTNGIFPEPSPGSPTYHTAIKAGLTGTLTGNTPNVNIDNISSFGLGFEGAAMADQATPVNLDVAWVKGSHDFKFGAQYVAFPFTFRRDEAFSYEPGGSGAFNFSRRETGLPGFTPDTGVGYASYLIGEVDSATVSTPSDGRNFTSEFGLFAQDNWRVTHKLTVNYGLRWEYYSPMKALQDKISSFDPTLANPGAGGRPGALTIYGKGTGRNGLTTINTSYYKAFAPKIGVAYAPDPKTVVRANFGISYLPMVGKYYAGNGQFAPLDGFADYRTIASTDNGVTPAFNWQGGFPYTFPPLPLLDPTLDNNGTINFVDRNDNRPSMTVNFGLEVGRELPHQISLRFGYVGTNLHRMYESFPIDALPLSDLSLGPLLVQDINSPAAHAAGIPLPYPGFQGSVAQALLPYPQYLGVTNLMANIGNQTYNALQVSAEKRFGNLIFNINYTNSKTLTNVNFPGSSNPASITVQSMEIRKTAKALGSLDTPQRFNLSWVYALPFGTGKRYLGNASSGLNKVIGNWSISGIQTYASSGPLSVGTEASIPGGISVWPVLKKGVPIRATGCSSLQPGNPNRQSILNINAFADPAPYTLGNVYTLPNVRGCGFFNEDLGLDKAVNLSERWKLTFGAMFRNALNRHQFVGFGTDIDSPGGFGVPTATTAGRQVQLYANLNF